MNKVIGFAGLLLVGGVGIVLLLKMPKVSLEFADEPTAKPKENAPKNPPPIASKNEIGRPERPQFKPNKNVVLPEPVKPNKNVVLPEPVGFNKDVRPPVMPQPSKIVQAPEPTKNTNFVVSVGVRPPVMPQPSKGFNEKPTFERPVKEKDSPTSTLTKFRG